MKQQASSVHEGNKSFNGEIFGHSLNNYVATVHEWKKPPKCLKLFDKKKDTLNKYEYTWLNLEKLSQLFLDNQQCATAFILFLSGLALSFKNVHFSRSVV